MLNYVTAEIYKLRRNRRLPAGLLLLLALESLVFLSAFHEPGGFLQTTYLGFFVPAINIGVLIVPVFAAAVYDNQESNGTLKNEVVYGIPRSRVYLGKLLAGAFVGALYALAAAGWFLLLTLVLGAESPAAPVHWIMAWAALGCSWCVWIAAYAWTFFLMVELKNTVGALLASYVSTLGGLFACAVISVSDAPQWLRTMAECFYAFPILSIIAGLNPLNAALVGGVLMNIVPDLLAYTLVVSVLWVCGTTTLGVYLFGRREIP